MGLLLLIFTLLAPVDPARGFSVVSEGDRARVLDGAGQLVGTVGGARVVDATVATVSGDVSLFLIVSSQSEGPGQDLVYMSVETTARKETRVGLSTTGRLRVRLRRDLARFKPWKVRLADVDGDGRPELALGVHKLARFDPVMRNRLFIYDWPGLAPRWLGSRLSLPFVDFAFADCDGDGKDELFALEEARDGRRRLMHYTWNGFGFAGMEDGVEVSGDFKLMGGLCPRKESRP